MDYRYWIWLAEACGAGSIAGDRLFSAFGEDAEAIWRADADALDKVEGLSKSARAALADKSLARAEEIIADCQRLHIGILTTDDPTYPSRLRRIPAHPIVLYRFGNLPDLDDQVCIATVGTRRMTAYGERMAYAVAYDLAKGGAIVVSGMAAGIDGACHRAALDAGGHTIAVLGCGIDRVYPAFHRALMSDIARRGTLLSEYPPGTPPIGTHFPARNRIISGLCQGTLVVEADLRSGAMITARCAQKQGRDIYSLPGKVGEQNSDGTLRLLAQGAKLVTGGVDILEEYEYIYPHRIKISNVPAFELKHTVSPIPKKVETPPMVDPAELKQEHTAALPFEVTPCKAERKPKAPKRAASTRRTTERDAQKKPARALPVLSAAEQKVFALFEDTPLTADALAAKSGEPVASILLALTLLELKGCVRAVAGGAYQSNFTSENQ